jgi:hypothetical protein
VEETMLKDRRVTVRELCEMIPDVSKTCIDKILTDHLGYANVVSIQAIFYLSYHVYLFSKPFLNHCLPYLIITNQRITTAGGDSIYTLIQCL